MYPIVTLQQAIEDDIHPGELFRAARLNERHKKPVLAVSLRKLGYAVARARGIRIRHRAASNDNRYRSRRAVA